MKRLLFVCFLFAYVPAIAGQNYKGLPVIKTNQWRASYKIGNDLVPGGWGISPEASPDVFVVAYSKPLPVGFITEQDSIFFNLGSQDSFRFYILVGDTAYALTEIRGLKETPIALDMESGPGELRFLEDDSLSQAYTKRFRDQYQLDEVIKGCTSDSARALRIVHWAHQQWPHNGGNMPSRPDAFVIMDEAAGGAHFRCTEYSIVTRTALKSIGLRARMMYIYSSDVETAESGGSHVVTEVYLNDMQKWAMVDGQYDVMPVSDGVPLNTAELQKAIVSGYSKLEIRSISAMNKRRYTNWIYPYLYYFETDLDNRDGYKEKQAVNGYIGLRMGPLGSKNPARFQGKWPMSIAGFTNAYHDLYRTPS